MAPKWKPGTGGNLGRLPKSDHKNEQEVTLLLGKVTGNTVFKGMNSLCPLCQVKAMNLFFSTLGEKKVTSYYYKSLEISFCIIVVVCGIFVYNRSIVRPMPAFTEIITFLF